MKDLNYYMSLPYEISVKELSEEDGGGFFISIPLLGKMAVCAHGETYRKARKKLEAIKKDFFEIWLNEGIEIPEPPSERNDMEKCLKELGVFLQKEKFVSV